ncbi:hypothetical protein [Cupriavidus oxalaticus]|uniref:Uncharacterized protein n=1 Tax=Cupriavidus oxalaticus TaxID=96344 RepID=A0A4P7LJM0_9BURK|nr:hypothetical protein [Cupriavidus oxalaticus]QBY56454.1 hypothetical protein E0W60_36330 [Cupriavidus oxalaticus]
MPELVLVAASGKVPFAVHLDDSAIAKVIHIRSGPNSRLALAIESPIAIPQELLAQGGTRLLTFAEIRARLIADGTAFEDRWHALVDRLSRIEVKLPTSVGRGVMLNGVELLPSGASDVSALFMLNVREYVTEEAALQANLKLLANCEVKISGAVISTTLSLEFVVDGLVPQFTLLIPEFPFRLPAIPLPDFDWAKLGSTSLTWPEVRLPALPFMLVTITHKAATFNGSVSAGNKLEFVLTIEGIELAFAGNKAVWGNIEVSQKGGALEFEYVAALPKLACIPFSIRLPGALDPLELDVQQGQLHLLVKQNGDAMVFGWLEIRLAVRSVTDKTKSVTVAATLPFEGEKLVGSVADSHGNNVSRKVWLVDTNFPLETLVSDLPDGFSIRLGVPGIPTPNLLPTLRNFAALLAEVLAVAGRALSGLAQFALRALEALAAKLADALSGLDVTLVLDRKTGNLQQVLFSVHRSMQDGSLDWERMGFQVKVPADVDLAVLLDLREGRRDAFAIASVDTSGQHPVASIATDLWLGTASSERPTGELAPQPGKTPHLIAVDIAHKASAAGRVSVVPFGIRGNRATFLHGLQPALPPANGNPSVGFRSFELIELDDSFEERFTLNPDAVGKLLPFLSAPKDDPSQAGGVLDTLKQYIRIDKIYPPRKDGGMVRTALDVEINTVGSVIEASVGLEVETRTLTARVSTGAIAITVDEGKFSLLGMSGNFYDKASGKRVTADQLVLDLGGTDSRLYVKEGVELRLQFGELSPAGKSLVLKVSNFVMHGGGLDLDAALEADATIPLNGLGTDFTFKSARLSVRDSRVAAFALTATGKLPPALLGDVDSQLHLSFGMRGKRFALIDGSLDLVNKGKPFRCEQTHFVFTLDGLGVRVFEDDAGGLHFCAFVSGCAEFRPEVSELANGMFKKLAGVELSFTDCPVCGPSEIIERELRKLNLSFVVALDNPARANLFDLFKFEVRSIGFEPNCKIFGDPTPALVIGGQCEFADVGDVVRVECDFHKLYIAPPAAGFLPRIRCEGLGVAIRLGSAFEIEGKAVAVDGRMPLNVLESRRPDDSLKANGFMGQGRIAIQGFPPMAASFGFVEVFDSSWAAPKRAWFVYIEVQRLSYYFQLGPVPLYLREIGLGLGYHFTYVAIKEIDQATSLPPILAKLDAIASEAVEPARLEAWALDNTDGLTLVARAMISMSSASAPTETVVWKPDEEKELPNVLLLNALMAMRNTTFVMTAQAWLGWNYHDWDSNRNIGGNQLVGKQAMTGYIVLVGSRSEFLARLKSTKGAEIGPRLALPDAFKNALKEIEYEATLYIRPGLLHMELGWPNRIRWTKNIAGANLTVAGGAIFRIHEDSLLVGLNLEGQLTFAMSGALDAGVVGIAVSASVYAAITARIIGYLDARRASDSLYYSLFSLQIRVQFSVSAWLEIDAWLCKITIRASFSLSLQVDVLAELAIRGDGSLGTRVRATIAVSVFGRSLGLSIGLASNTGLVDAAAARVAQFMQVGLEQPVPSVSPTLARQDQALEKVQQTGAVRRDAQAIAGSANSHPDQLAPVPQEEALPKAFVRPGESKCNPIGPTDFHIVATYPRVPPADRVDLDPSEWVYLTFLPLDARTDKRASFYAAPPIPNITFPLGVIPAPDHCVDLSGLPISGDTDIYRWSNGNWVPVAAADVAHIETTVRWNAALTYEESTKDKGAIGPMPDTGKANLGDLFFAAFRTSAQRPQQSAPYYEPATRLEAVLISDSTRSGDMVDAHVEQQRRYANAIHIDPADRRCHEARDFLLHKFVSDLFSYAADGATPQQAHALDLGLTFLVRRKVLNGASEDAPVAFVKKRVADEQLANHWLPSMGCKVFNPPSKTFEKASPTFSLPQSDCSGGKVRLDWELQWKHGDNVEHYLQYSEIRRSIELPSRTIESDPICVKRADADSAAGPNNVSDTKRRIVRGEWQFTDEFEDLTPAQRKELREAGTAALVRYSITPVCVSNTRGRMYSNFVLPFGGWPELEALREARAFFTIDPSKEPEKRLQVVLELSVKNQTIPAGGERAWRLLLRPQEIIPSGQYGSDAETQRSLGGWLGSSSVTQPGDVEICIRATTQPDQDDVLRLKLENAAADAVRKVLADTSNPRAWRILAQQVVCEKDQCKDLGRVLVESACVEVELNVELRTTPGSTQRFIGLRPGAFEYIRQAEGDEATVLEPVAAQSLEPVDAGRAILVVPDVKGAVCVPHPDFGAATQLMWNVTPPGLDTVGLARYRMLAGFDILRLDLDGAEAPNAAESATAWTSARRVASVRLLERDKIPLIPGEVGEVANWKAVYPSRAARQRARGAWYSPAESYIEWPPMQPRFEVIPEPSRELLAALLRKGVPDVIKLRIDRQRSHESSPEPQWSFALRKAGPANTAKRDAINTAWELRNEDELHFVGSVDDAAQSLRSALRRLQAYPVDKDKAPFDKDCVGLQSLQLRAWQLNLNCMFRPDSNAEPISLLREQVALDYDRALHPLLESVITRMRRSPDGRPLEADRRPPPSLKAKSMDEFMAATNDTQDPYGWLMLDRLGLGVTLRLFDPFDDSYLGFEALQEQLKKAVAELQSEQMHTEALRFLTVELLLQPGGLVQTVPFDAPADPDGTLGPPEDGWLRDHALSMIRISVRPRIVKYYSYRVERLPASATEDALKGGGGFDAMLAGDTNVSSIAKPADLMAMLAAADAGGSACGHVVFIRYRNPIGTLGDQDLLPGLGGDLPDAYGRFPPVKWAVDEAELTQLQISRFCRLLNNVLGLDPDNEDSEKKTLGTYWLKYNQRFFEHASGAPLDGTVTCAYAATEANEPVMVAQDRYGRARIVIPEADGYAHQFAYAVTPQWRYASVLEAAGHCVVAQRGADTANDVLPFVVASVERTAPVLPPALIALGRLQDVVWWRTPNGLVATQPHESPGPGATRLGIDPGLSSVLLLPHHPERRIARANAPAQRNLAHAGELFTQLGTPADPAWCQAFLRALPRVPTFDDVARVPPDVAAIAAIDSLASPLLAFERARVRLVSYLPHWYRTFAAVAAGAGTEVSVPAVAALPNPAARLVLIDRATGTRSLIGGHSWTGETEVDGTGVRAMDVEVADGATAHAVFGRRIDLLQYRDTTDPVTESLWRDDVARVPDPGVIYQLDLVAPPRPAQGEPRAAVDPLARVVRAAPDAQQPYKVMPISRDWQVTATPEKSGRALRVMLSPLGKGLTLPGMPADAFPEIARGADGALRVPGGWSLAWLTVLLDRLPQASGEQRLAWAAQLWERLVSDGIGVAHDKTKFFEPLPAAQLYRMEVVKPRDDAEWTQLINAFDAWAKHHGNDPAPRLIATLVCDRLEPLLHKRWPYPGGALDFDVPWLPGLIDKPITPLIAMEQLSQPRYLLPDLMSPKEFHLLAVNAQAKQRATALWSAQKELAMGSGLRLHITAQRGDAVPLQLLPLKLV